MGTSGDLEGRSGACGVGRGVGGAPVDSVSLVRLGVAFAEKDVAEVAAAVRARRLGHVDLATQLDVRLLARVEALVVGDPTRVRELAPD